MFNSTGNNFGGGVIQFKDVQESNYIVLNAKFTCSPQSAEAGVMARYKERGTSYGYPYIYDGGTVLKSWVKDANTLCIEKLPVFDDQEEFIIYIQTLYCQLAQGGNSTKEKEKRITATSEDEAPPFQHVVHLLRRIREMDLLPYDVQQRLLGVPEPGLGGLLRQSAW